MPRTWGKGAEFRECVRTHIHKIGRVGRQAGGSGEEGRGGTKTGVCFLEQKAVKTTVLACAY